MALPGLPGLPNLSFGSSSETRQQQTGNVWDMGNGDWVVNLGSSSNGAGVPSANSGSTWLLLATLALALWNM